MIKTELKHALVEVLESLGISDITPQIDTPTDLSHGDYTTNVALIAAKEIGKPPRALAEEIVSTINKQLSTLKLEKVDVAGPGFINFWVTKEALLGNLIRHAGENPTAGAEDTRMTLPNIGKGKTVIVEFSSPNIAKPFTIGHLRSTIIGDAIANLLEAVGYAVKRDNHIGDWGTQFGKQMYAIKTWGDEAAIEQSENPVKALVDLYIKFHEEAEKNPQLEDAARDWFKKLEDGDPEARRLWEKCIAWSWKEFAQIYDVLNVHFTENNGRGYGESFFEDKMQPVIAELTAKDMLREGKEGASMVFFPDDSKLPPLMILKKDGTTLYSTRDLATDKFRLEKYGKDITIINEVGAEQSLYFQQLYMLESMLGWYEKRQRVHVKHGLYRFKDEKMSTRKGNVIWLEEVLEEAQKRAFALSKREIPASKEAKSFSTDDISIGKNSETAREHKMNIGEINKTARQIGIGALKWNDLKRSSHEDIVFDWETILSMEGNSGPYMQYTYVRTQSVLRKAEEAEGLGQSAEGREFMAESMEPEEVLLLRLLYKFDETIIDAAEKYSPNILCLYLFTVAQQFNVFYQASPILKASDEKREFRLALTSATGVVIKKGLSLLGIKTPKRM